ncbi:diguanylate cyclase domain-containing protein [Sporomusa termitida]|uniref:GGDEF: diguanylate cyclase (GGDEF) domain protein n=1 Tax=Sporomusa termitida TaxID=2377 RepID=A0A517DP47_9FIRM|nr:diguanylate cyclase [Sporomusa termitida]QDR79067.1 GGDEF: diguanylate cyclase (GGDEF) domain protein [Sporomusa termitida]
MSFTTQDNGLLKCVYQEWGQREDFNFYLSILSHQFNFVFNHSQRVAYYAVRLAQATGCRDTEIVNIGAMALLHDIGKINVPIKVLYKQGTYDPYDRNEMERHPVYGSQMLLRSKELRELIAGVLHHHERYDGNGYPNKLKALEIPLPARIIHIAEAVDVMTTIQNYQQVRSWHEAMGELERAADSQFDRALVKAFLALEPAMFAAGRMGAGQAARQEKQQLVLSAGSVGHYLENIANLGVICLDKNNTVVFCNACAEQIRQLPEGTLLGKNFLDSYPQHRRKILEDKLGQLRAGKKKAWYRLMGRNGRFIENRYSRVTDASGKFIGTVLVTIDVTEREKVARSLNAALERQAALYQAAQIITSSLSIAEIIDGILRIIRKTMVVNKAEIYLSSETNDGIPAMHTHEYSRSEPIEGQEGYREAANQVYSTLRTVMAADEQGKLAKYYVPLIYRRDLLGILYIERTSPGEESQERLELLEALASQTAIAIRNARLHEEVQYLAEYDKLTGLLNRHSFDRFFAEQCRQAAEQPAPVTLLMIDINGLKLVNDQYGHVAGDMLIKAAAQVVKNSISSDDRAFRYGGDEIVVLLPGVSLPEAQIIIKRIQRNSKWWQPGIVANVYADLTLSVSIGAAASSEVSLECLIQEADKRMYESKRLYYKSLDVK